MASNTNIQIYKYTNIQIHKFTNSQLHNYTTTQLHKCRNTQIQMHIHIWPPHHNLPVYLSSSQYKSTLCLQTNKHSFILSSIQASRGKSLVLLSFLKYTWQSTSLTPDKFNIHTSRCVQFYFAFQLRLQQQRTHCIGQTERLFSEVFARQNRLQVRRNRSPVSDGIVRHARSLNAFLLWAIIREQFLPIARLFACLFVSFPFWSAGFVPMRRWWVVQQCVEERSVSNFGSTMSPRAGAVIRTRWHENSRSSTSPWCHQACQWPSCHQQLGSAHQVFLLSSLASPWLV